MARPRLTRAEQRFNWLLAATAVALLVVLAVFSQQLIVAVLAAAFLFGLGQMVVGLTRRRRFLREYRAEGREAPFETGPPGYNLIRPAGAETTATQAEKNSAKE